MTRVLGGVRWLPFASLLALAATACGPEAPADSGGPFTFEFTTEEVTDPDVAVSPEGETLVFTMAGHLFRLPTRGGDAEQLTFGLGYDFDPVFAPDGERLAFVSDRDGTEGNVFVLELGSGDLRQLTREPFGVARPAWSPDGAEIVYLNLLASHESPWVNLASHYPSTLESAALTGAVRSLGNEPRFHTSVFFLDDGRLAFSEILPTDRYAWEFDPDGEPASTRIVALNRDGETETLASVGGMAHRVSLAPGGGGFLARHIPRPHRRGWGLVDEQVSFIPAEPDASPTSLATVTGTGGWDWGPAIGVHTRSGRIYFGQDGGLVVREFGGGESVENIPFRARVRHTAYRPTPVPEWTPPDPTDARPREVASPQELPGGRGTLVVAAGQLWRLPPGGPDAERMYGEPGIVRSVTLSPDGTRVALLIREHDLQILKVLTLGDSTAREVARGGDFSTVSWTRDGTEVLYGDRASEGIRDTTSVTPTGEYRFSVPLPAPTLISDIRVLDFRRGRFTDPTNVFLSGGRIRAIGDTATVGPLYETEHLAGEGRYLIPGLVDLHWHFYGVPSVAAYLPFYGVTSVREVGGGSADTPSPDSRTLAELGNLHPGLVPRVFYSGYYAHERALGLYALSPEEHAREGASWIKLYATLPWSTQAYLADQARQAGLPVAAHGWHAREVVKGATLGFASLEHMGYAWHDDLIRIVRNVGTAWVPTFGNMTADRPLALAEPERLDVPAVQAFGRRGVLPDESGYNPHGSMAVVWRSIEGQRASIRRAYEAGIPILVGTDMASEASLFGQSTHWEMEHLVDAGIPVLDVLRAATLGGAEAVGAERHLGSIEVGKLADLVILDADPLEDIHNTTRIWRVIKGGWVMDPDSIVQRLVRLSAGPPSR